MPQSQDCGIFYYSRRACLNPTTSGRREIKMPCEQKMPVEFGDILRFRVTWGLIFVIVSLR